MSHEIDFSTGKPAIAIAHDGAVPWHGYFNRMPHDADRLDWTQGAGLDWTALEAPSGAIHPQTGVFLPDPSKKLLYRSDTSTTLSTVSNQYEPHQPSEILAMFFDICHDMGFRPGTMGALAGGKKMWLQAHCPEDFRLPGEDITKTFLTLCTSFDCSEATKAWYGMLRVVCQNTLTMASNQVNDKVTLNHKNRFDAGYIKTELGLSAQKAEEHAAICGTLANAEIGPDQAIDFFQNLLQADAFKWDKETVREANIQSKDRTVDVALELNLDPSRKFEKIVECFIEGPGQDLRSCFVRDTHEGPVKTLYGAVNAITDYVDHHAGKTTENTLKSSIFGAGETLKSDAYRLAQAIAA